IFAAIKMAGYTGFSIAVAIYFLNESLGRPVQKMAAPVVAVKSSRSKYTMRTYLLKTGQYQVSTYAI
ncbi:YhfT family protein, partial [Escherichia coli]